jgi:hypothetical protein
MGATVTASNGAQLPIDSLPVNIVWSGSFVSTMTVVYAGVVYVQTYTNNGSVITAISNWVAQVPPVTTYMETESGSYTMITEDNNLMITELS